MSKKSVDALLDAVEWVAAEGVPDAASDVPYATHTGVLRIGELELDCVVLNTGQRLFTGPVIDELMEGLKPPRCPNETD